MKRLLNLAAIALIAHFPGNAQTGSAPSAAAADGTSAPSVTQIIEFAKASPFRTIVYAELDEGAPNGGIVGIGIVGQLPGTTTLVRYGEDRQSAFMQAISAEARASGKGGWRKLLIVADKGTVDVSRGPSPGGIDGFNARLRAEVDRAFPGLAKN